ncbi:MM0924 family protein [Methanosarcina sp. T3]|uniref:MM0924 family protein n=1 Tax=Methanosarcina sp. T3 TaxID=3439062 RepID=UPI003F82B2FA
MQSFIVEHLLDEVVDVYCGEPDIFNGKVKACADNVLTLENNGKDTHIAIDKVIAIWRVSDIPQILPGE